MITHLNLESSTGKLDVSSITKVKVVLFSNKNLQTVSAWFSNAVLLLQPQVYFCGAVFAELRGAEGINSN